METGLVKCVFYALLAAGIMTAPFSTCADEPACARPGWRQEFQTMPDGWKLKGKPGTPAAVFEPGRSADGSNTWLNMTADKASASLVVELPNVKLADTPILRWCWRVTVLPKGADGRESAKDDQAIGLYVSAGGMFSQKSLAYRWETETPIGEEGTASYAAGVVKVKWFCLRNKQSAKDDSFIIEERNVAADFKSHFGKVPEKIGMSVSCNSQYTGSKAEAQLAWVEFVPEQQQPASESAVGE